MHWARVGDGSAVPAGVHAAQRAQDSLTSLRKAPPPSEAAPAAFSLGTQRDHSPSRPAHRGAGTGTGEYLPVVRLFRFLSLAE